MRDDNDQTPLINAASFAGPSIIELLLDYGANINSRTWNGRTALMEALLNHNFTLAIWLVENGANTSIRFNNSYEPSFTPEEYVWKLYNNPQSNGLNDKQQQQVTKLFMLM